MCPTKKLILGAVVATLSFLYSSYQTHASEEETYFVTTAYYSPLSGQSRYTTGSYAGDIRLNGGGKITASGKGVFQGLLAGPKNYPFGTKIYFEGFGIGVVEDRGGAIVKAGERGHSYDRIDIWMGYGDEGLARALKWGTRTIKGKIVVPSSQISLKLGESSLGYIGNLRVTPDSDSTEVKLLQKIFVKADLYSGDIDGKYTSIQNELIDFQLKNGIIKSNKDEAAGYFGPKTIALLRQKYGINTAILIEEPIKNFSNFNHRYASEIYKIILNYGDLQVSPDSDEEAIKQLQQLLKQLSEYTGNIDGKYKSVEGSLLKLQKKIGLIKKNSDWGAGYFGNKTKTALWAYYEIYDINGNKITTSLGETEKKRISKAVELIRKKLKRSELRGGRSMEYKLSKLRKEIKLALPHVKDTILKEKLLYLQGLLSNG